jgi:hypothetical protein
LVSRDGFHPWSVGALNPITVSDLKTIERVTVDIEVSAPGQLINPPGHSLTAKTNHFGRGHDAGPTPLPVPVETSERKHDQTRLPG